MALMIRANIFEISTQLKKNETNQPSNIHLNIIFSLTFCHL